MRRTPFIHSSISVLVLNPVIGMGSRPGHSARIFQSPSAIRTGLKVTFAFAIGFLCPRFEVKSNRNNAKFQKATIRQYEFISQKRSRVRRLTALWRSGRRAEIELLGELLVNPAATVVTTPHPAPSKTTSDRATRDNHGPDMPSSRPLRFGLVCSNDIQHVIVANAHGRLRI